MGVETGESVCELANSIFFPSLKLFTNTDVTKSQ